jgi:four helix bundle protein
MEKSSRKTFREMEIYVHARKSTNRIYQIINTTDFKRDYELLDQMRRAARSIMFNFAEGSEKNSNPDFIRYLNNSKGSCAEIRAQIDIALDQSYISKEIYEEVEKSCVYISSMIGNFIKYLRKTAFKRKN